MAGQQVELIENYNKAYIAMDQLLPQASRVMNGAEGLPLIESAATTAKTEPILSKRLVAADGTVAPDGAATQACTLDVARSMRNAGLKEQDPRENAKLKAAVLADRYQPISCEAGKEQQLVAGPLLPGLCSTGYTHPIPHAPVSISLVPQPQAHLCCVTTFAASRIRTGLILTALPATLRLAPQRCGAGQDSGRFLIPILSAP